MDSTDPLIVRAIYTFTPSNNDELAFKKGDIITVTQKDEGWWEGTLDGKTGWFPSNYVKECKDVQKTSVNSPNQYKEVVLKDLIDSEKAHVTELLGLVTNFLQPLEKSATLTPDEYKQLTGNINEVLDVHQQLLSLIESESTKPGLEQRVGRLFLTWASRVKNVYQIYCSLHPRAVCILDKYKDELTKYMESKGASTPGVLVLTVLLSKPFRRLEKYSGMLQELERHVEESHPDRGDTQRSVAVYKEIANTCAATRRQKELELQVMSGPIRGWEGPPVSTLGEIIYMGSVAVGSHHHDRYFVLFPSVLLILAVSHRLSAFIFEGKLCLSGITANRLEDTDERKNAFEIKGSLIEKRIAICQSKDEANHWVELLTKQQKPRATSDLVVSKGMRFVHGKSIGLPTATTSDPFHQIAKSTNNSHSSLSLAPHQPAAFRSMRDWTSSSLRPTPPLRPCLGLGRALPYTRYPHNALNYKEEGLIFEVIESYCSSGKPRSTTNSVSLNNGPKTEVGSKRVEDDVVLLQMQINQLECNVNAILRALHEERRARYALQVIIKNHLQVNCNDVHEIEWPTMESNH